MEFDPSKPVRTRDGRKARVLATDQTVSEGGGYVYPIRAEVTHPNKPDEVVEWNYLADGRWKSNDHCNGNDLINEMPWHGWLDQYKVSRPTLTTKKK